MEKISIADDDREEIAHRLAPMLKNAVEAGGAYMTLLDAHKSLADLENKFEVMPAVFGPDVSKAAGLIIIVTS